jgi:hypothetical protein
MSRHEKLVERFLGKPRDFTWSELRRLLGGFGYKEVSGGGSRRKFIDHRGVTISLHEPHPENVLKAYQVREVLAHLQQERFL